MARRDTWHPPRGPDASGLAARIDGIVASSRPPGPAPALSFSREQFESLPRLRLRRDAGVLEAPPHGRHLCHNTPPRILVPLAVTPIFLASPAWFRSAAAALGSSMVPSCAVWRRPLYHIG